MFENSCENFPWTVQEISILELPIEVVLVAGKGFRLVF